MKNCDSPEIVTSRARHADHAALERNGGELGLEVRIFRAAGTVEIFAVAGLRHEAVHDAMEWNVIVESITSKLLDALGMFGRDVGPQLDDNLALRGVDHDGVLLVETGRQWLRKSGDHEYQRGDEAKDSNHDNSGSEEDRFIQPANLVLSFDATSCGTKADTSPPIIDDLAHQCGGDRANAGRSRNEHRMHVGGHSLVHAGDLHFIVEIGAIAQAPNQIVAPALCAATTVRSS